MGALQAWRARPASVPAPAPLGRCREAGLALAPEGGAERRSAAAASAFVVCRWSRSMAASKKGSSCEVRETPKHPRQLACGERRLRLQSEMALHGCFSLKYPGNPQLGDLIEVFRPGYQHWALYLGDGYVINIAPLEDGTPGSFTSAKSVFSRKALVKMQLLKEVVGNDTYRINNKYDETYPPLPLEEVMQRSEFVIGQEVAYDVFDNNCEHFVTLLRYGEGISEQANRAISTIGFVTAAASAFSLLGLLPKCQRVKYF